MKLGSILRGAAIVALTMAAASAWAASGGHWRASPPLISIQAGPPAAEEPALPPAVEGEVQAETPPPILPAPHMPGDDPVAELPPPEPPAPPAMAPANGMFSFADLAERLLDSVVYISTSQRVSLSRRAPLPRSPESPKSEDDGGGDQQGEDFFDDFFDNGDGTQPDSRAVQSLGSGFVIDPSGYVVTNNHVIADADEIVANFANGEKLEAKVVGIDDKTDLALLKVEPKRPLKPAKFGRSESLRVGDWVIAIGNPFGFGGTVTAGIVSALDRDINSGPYDHYIQTDASINRGNSGGPLFNVAGEVVGINTAIMSPTGGSIGIGFSVPSEIAVPVIEQIRRFGEVRRGWIGVRIQDVTDEVAAGLGMEEAEGAFIAGMTEDGPAAKAGVEEGDVVVEFNGKKVETMRALPRLVADTPPGDTVDVKVIRDGKPLTLSIEIGLLEDKPVKQASAEPGDSGENGDMPGDAPDAAPPVDAAGMFGLSLGAITEEARGDLALDTDVNGVLVTAVEPGSEASDKNLQPGEVIVQVSQTDVATPDEVVSRIDELKSEGRSIIMLLVWGKDHRYRFVSLRFEEGQ